MPSPSNGAVLSYVSRYDGNECAKQIQPTSNLGRGSLIYANEYLTAQCPYTPPPRAAPFVLTPPLIVAIALGGIGTLALVLCAIICYCQVHKAILIRRRKSMAKAVIVTNSNRKFSEAEEKIVSF